jgi:hypothetical protein
MTPPTDSMMLVDTLSSAGPTIALILLSIVSSALLKTTALKNVKLRRRPRKKK